MSAPKFTPGPWEAVHPKGDENALDVYPVGNRHYKIMHGAWGAMADARLVAAAPDLLAALEQVLGGCPTCSAPAARLFGHHCAVGGHAEARAAVAKARGQS